MAMVKVKGLYKLKTRFLEVLWDLEVVDDVYANFIYVLKKIIR
jgi:hypothetical protein